MKKYQHGGNTNIKYDFSANINPLGMPENVKSFHFILIRTVQM